jgi:hypothetical protein
MIATLKALSRVEIITSPASVGGRLVTIHPSAELWAKPGKKTVDESGNTACGVNKEKYLSTAHLIYDIWKHNNI